MPDSDYSLLQNITDPADLRRMPRGQLGALAAQLRAFLLHSVSKTGGHLSSNLGTVELTVALHYVFNTPHDRLVWDVGHQTYPHKILTGRRERMDTPAPARRPERLSAAQRERLRRLRHGAFQHLDLGRAGHGAWRRGSRARTATAWPSSATAR